MACGKPVAGGTFVVARRSSSATESDETRTSRPDGRSDAGDLPRSAGRRARRSVGRVAGRPITKPPKLVKFVPAVYPKDKHDAHVTGSVLLSIEIGDDGKVGEVEVVKGGRARLRRRRGGGGQAVRLRAGRDRPPAGAGEDHLPLRLHDRRGDRQGRAADQLRRRGAGALQEDGRIARRHRHHHRPGRPAGGHRRRRPLRLHSTCRSARTRSSCPTPSSSPSPPKRRSRVGKRRR